MLVSTKGVLGDSNDPLATYKAAARELLAPVRAPAKIKVQRKSLRTVERFLEAKGRQRLRLIINVRQCAYGTVSAQVASAPLRLRYLGSLSNRNVQQPRSRTFFLAASWLFRAGITV